MCHGRAYGRAVSRLRYHLGAAAAALGLALAPADMRVAAVAALCVLTASLACGAVRVGAVCAVLVVAGALAGSLRLQAIDTPGSGLSAYEHVDGRAVLLERPRSAGTRIHAAVRLLTGEARGTKLLAVREGPWPGPTDPGEELRVAGVAKAPVRAGGDHFDWPGHLRRHGIAYELHVSRIEATGHRRGGVTGAVDAARRRAEDAIESSLPADKAALLRGMVLGQDEAVDPLTRDDWRDSGLAHLLAVSGQNVLLLCALALPLLALAGISSHARIAVLLALIALYVPLAGAGPSLQRAAVMGAAGLVALAASRPASASYGLLAAAVVTLAVNPRVLGDVGWQLSFAAVAGILAARPFAPRGSFAGMVWLSAVAGIATTPLLALHFETVPLASVPANLAALPAVAPVMWIGMLDAALGQLTALGPLGRTASGAATQALALLAEPLLAWLDAVASHASSLPHSTASVRVPGPAAVVGAYAALAAIGWTAVRLARRAAPALDAPRARLRALPRPTVVALAAAGAAGALLAAAHAGSPPPPDRLTVSFLDVGQGDATLIQHPDGGAVLFDGGRADARVARLLRQVGVRRLGAVVATHASADHHAGLAEVLERFPVELLLNGGDGTADPTFAALLATARARGVRVVKAIAGREVGVGGLTIRVLSPEPRPPGPPPEDPNPRAVVATVSSGGFDLFLSADAESQALAPLDLPDVDAMKVPHHGSADPGLPALLERLRPEIAVIEVGENSYGHPHPETIAALERAVPAVRRTDRDGTVRLRVAAGRMSLD